MSYSSDNISFAVTQVPGLRDKWSWFFFNDHTKGIPLSQDEPLKICIIWGNVLPLALGVCTPHRLYFSSVWARNVETGVESLKPLQSEQDLDLLLLEKVLLFLCVCRPAVSPFSKICKISHHLPVNSDTPSLWPWTAYEAHPKSVLWGSHFPSFPRIALWRLTKALHIAGCSTQVYLTCLAQRGSTWGLSLQATLPQTPWKPEGRDFLHCLADIAWGLGKKKVFENQNSHFFFLFF